MGNYNPHAPYILGMEWVPIRDAKYEPDQITEKGYTFRLEHAAPAVSGAVYVQFPPKKVVNNVAEAIYVYPVDTEDQTGPIRKVTIPVSNVLITGNGEFMFDEGVAAWLNPSDSKTQPMSASTATPTIGLNFAVENYSQELFGKRILSVRFVYTAAVSLAGIQNFVEIGMSNVVYDGSNYTIYQAFVEGPIGVSAVAGLTLITDLKYVDFGDLNINLSNPISVLGDASSLALPWRYQELLLFSTTTPLASRRVLLIRPIGLFEIDGLFGSVEFGYGALEVFYCEETRVRYGGRFTNFNRGTGAITEGANFIALRDTSFSIPSALPVGEYLITHTHHELKPTFIAREAPTLHAVRQLYELPSHQGTVVDSRVIEGAQFTSTTTDELTPITLHTATAIVTGTHPYGTSLGAPVYGSITATQEIEDDAVDGTRQYQQVRFYARRYGDTSIPLTLTDVATGLSTVSISVAEFDALPEIVDGWREVTLRFTTAPTFTAAAGDVDWRWSATGETAGNQWQVLLADGPSQTGAQTTGPATYYAPVGATVNLTWKSPNVSGATEDSISDAVLIFSQDPPTVSGFALETVSQTITGVGQFCGSDPRCVPTAIQGNRLTWTPFGACDNFNRVEVDQWGEATSGQDWSIISGTASNYSVNGTQGVLTIPTGDTVSRNILLPDSFSDVDIQATFSVSQLATGGSINQQIRFRSVDNSNYYYVSLAYDTTGNVDISIVRVLAGATTSLVSSANFVTYTANSSVHVYLQARGTTLRAKIWITDVNYPPVNWSLSTTDSNFSAGRVGVRAQLSGGNTNVDPAVYVDNYTVVASQLLGGGQVEIQRRDVLTDWQTIMHTYSASCVGGVFDDYEARVGVESEYRIRTLNALDFAGPWATGSGTIPTPGVTVGGDGTSLLIFTSNELPTASLAYTMQFEGRAIEQFVFPEVDQVQLQRMFGKNFFTAFHPLERGGEQFTRILLVNAAAVALPSLANFRGLRDLAWASLDYVCIRDELGNRWFANVRVPEGTVQLDRTIYLVQVQVSEVTDTAGAVDPATVVP